MTCHDEKQGAALEPLSPSKAPCSECRRKSNTHPPARPNMTKAYSALGV